MAAPSYTRSLDTLASIALDEMSGDLTSLITELGEKFHKHLLNAGRIFVVNDAEGIRHPLMYTGTETPTYYAPDDDGSGTYNNLSTQAREVVTWMQATQAAAAMNVNYPQSHPSGSLVDYVDARIRAVMEKAFNDEEKLLLVGATNGTPTLRAPFYGDTADYTAGYPTNLYSILHGGTETSGNDAAAVDRTDEQFFGVEVDEVGDEFLPYKTAVTSASLASGVFKDLQNAWMQCYYSEMERPDLLLTNATVFQTILDLLRTDGALPDPIHYNTGLQGTFNFAGMTIDWSRYLPSHAKWDSDTVNGSQVANAPIVGINTKSLRLNVVRRGGSLPNDPVGIFQLIGATTVAHTKPLVFQRIAWKRCLSFDRGRRSFFHLYGCTLT